jgi:hypothetical protein
MKCVMFYTEGDGCTYSCDASLPFEYESAEVAIVDFERLCTEAHTNAASRGKFTFAGMEFYTGTFRSHGLDRFYFPEFFTLDEWFESQRIDK